MRPMDQTDGEQYEAFISYSRKDIEFASRLEKALENFKPPSSLALPPHYLRIFRDVSDMTGADYDESIQDKIQKSAKLIVICSPAARQSPRKYVDDEIQRFAQAKGAENIIPLIVAGIPNEEAEPEQAAEMAFPEALCTLKKTLSADYRGFDPRKDKINKGNFSNSWYKLLAELFNLSRGEIEQRDLKRKLRRRNIATTITLNLMLIFAGVAVYAWMQKIVAETRGRIALSRQLSAQSKGFLDSQIDLALLLGAKAVGAHETVEARDSLLAALQKSPQLKAFLHGHEQCIMSLAFSPKGNIMASGGKDGKIILWDVSKLCQLPDQLPQIHKGWVTSVAFTPDGNILASGGKDGKICFYDLTARPPHEQPSPHEGHEGWVILAFHRDGNIMASGGEDGKIILWDSKKRQPLPNRLKEGQKKFLIKLAFDSMGKTLASRSLHDEILVWDFVSGAFKHKLYTGARNELDTSSMDLSSDGRFLAAGGGDRKIIFWDLTKSPPQHQSFEQKSGVLSVAFSKKKNILASGGEDGKIVLWDAVSGQPLGRPLEGHRGRVFSLAFNPDGQILASGSEDGKIILWELMPRSALGQQLNGQEFGVVTVAFSHDGNILATGGKGGKIMLWDVTKRCPMPDQLPNIHRDWVYNVAFGFDDKFLISAEMGNILIWDLTARRSLPLGEDKDAIRFGALSPNGKILFAKSMATGNHDKPLFWDVASRRPLPDQPPEGNQVGIKCAAFSPKGDILAGADNENKIILWDVGKRRPLPNQLPQRGVECLAFSPNSQLLASGDEYNKIILWDVAKGNPLPPPLEVRYVEGTIQKRSPVHSVAFSPNGEILASGYRDNNTVRLWDVTGHHQLGQLLASSVPEAADKRGVDSIAFSPSGELLASGSSDGKIMLWDVDVKSWSRRARAIANRPLTPDELDRYLGKESTRSQIDDWEKPKKQGFIRILQDWLVDRGILPQEFR